MAATKTVLQSTQAPSLGLNSVPPSFIFQDADNDPDAGSLCLTCQGASTGDVYYSLFPWTTETQIPNTSLSGSPAFFSGDDQLGRVWVWKDDKGSGMSWCTDGVIGVQSVPNHAHTDESPAVALVECKLDPITGGIDYNLFTLFWKGDCRQGGDGSDHSLWCMSYNNSSGWGPPVQIPGASPAGSPSVALGGGGFGPWGVTLVWADKNGQIWLTGTVDSGDAQATWVPPYLGPSAFTLHRPAITWFQGILIIAWTLQDLGWIMYSTLYGEGTWSDPARLCKGQTGKGPAMMEQNSVLYVAYRGYTSNSIYYETFHSIDDLSQTRNPKGVLLSINNTIIGHAFTCAMLIGHKQTLSNLLVDTGSVAIAVLPSVYDARTDVDAVSTALALSVVYDENEIWWIGPLVRTTVASPAYAGTARPSEKFQSIFLGVATFACSNPPVFGGADGIFGLAYTSLSVSYDPVYDFSSNLKEIGKAFTFPWPWPFNNKKESYLEQFQKLLNTGIPSVPVPLGFTQFEQNGLLPNKFALWVYRAVTNNRMSNVSLDPSNWGILVLGGGEDYFVNDIGAFQEVAVVEDKFYYLTLTSIQIGNCSPILIFLPESQLNANALVDSGTAQIKFDSDVWNLIVTDFASLNPRFGQIIQAATSNPFAAVSSGDLNFNEWPRIRFTFVGISPGSVVELFCYPIQYWQSDSPQGFSKFMLKEENGNGAYILGLTFLSGYYTIFDRSVGSKGVIRFAEKPVDIQI